MLYVVQYYDNLCIATYTGYLTGQYSILIRYLLYGTAGQQLQSVQMKVHTIDPDTILKRTALINLHKTVTATPLQRASGSNQALYIALAGVYAQPSGFDVF